MGVDRFGNPHAPNLSYARGKILRSTEDDFHKLQRAWALIRERGPDNVYIFTGLEHSLPLAIDELPFADDEIAPALCFERLKALALDHLGGSPETDDVAVFNRLTGVTMATHLTLIKPDDVVVGVSASRSHPSVVRAARPMTCCHSTRSRRSSGLRMTRAPSSISTMPAAHGLVLPVSVSRGCWNSVSILVRPVSTNTAQRARASACSPAERTWSVGFA